MAVRVGLSGGEMSDVLFVWEEGGAESNYESQQKSTDSEDVATRDDRQAGCELVEDQTVGSRRAR
jgi:hypothetical protein